MSLSRTLASWGRTTRPRIFLSYRRKGESAGYAARLADRLVAHFGEAQVFRDIEDIETGVDFVQAIEQAVASCQALIVVIGTDWLDTADAGGRRRLDNPKDFVRLEVAAALQRNVRVIPVLVCGAAVPSEEQLPADMAALARRQAHELSDSRWDYDVGRLVSTLESVGIRPHGRAKRAEGRRPAGKLAILGGAAAGGFIVLMLVANLVDTGTTFQPAGKSGLLDAAGTDAKQVPDADPAGVATPVQNQPTGGTTAPAQVPQDVNAAILDVLDRGARARIFAEQAMDPQALAQVYTANALQFRVGELTRLAGQGEFAVNVLHGANMNSLQLSPDGMYATAQVTETWSANHFHTLTRQCVHHIPPHPVPQTIYLTRIAGPWMIYGFEIHLDQQPATTTCG